MEETMEMTMEPAEEMSAAPQEEPASGGLQENDLMEFVREHPGLDARTIPTAVWDAVKQGDTLSRAYGRHEMQQLRSQNQQLHRQLGELQRAGDARGRSLGSMRSAGAGWTTDSFLAGFNEE